MNSGKLENHTLCNYGLTRSENWYAESTLHQPWRDGQDYDRRERRHSRELWSNRRWKLFIFYSNPISTLKEIVSIFPSFFKITYKGLQTLKKSSLIFFYFFSYFLHNLKHFKIFNIKTFLIKKMLKDFAAP